MAAPEEVAARSGHRGVRWGLGRSGGPAVCKRGRLLRAEAVQPVQHAEAAEALAAQRWTTPDASAAAEATEGTGATRAGLAAPAPVEANVQRPRVARARGSMRQREALLLLELGTDIVQVPPVGSE